MIFGSKFYDQLTVYLYEYVGYYEQSTVGLAAERRYCAFDLGSIVDRSCDRLHMQLGSALVERAQKGLVRRRAWIVDDQFDCRDRP